MKIEKGTQFSIKGNAYKGKVFTCLEVIGDEFRCEDEQGISYTFTADLLFDRYGVEAPREFKRRVVKSAPSRLEEFNHAPLLPPSSDKKTEVCGRIRF